MFKRVRMQTQDNFSRVLWSLNILQEDCPWMNIIDFDNNRRCQSAYDKQVTDGEISLYPVYVFCNGDEYVAIHEAYVNEDTEFRTTKGNYVTLVDDGEYNVILVQE